MNGISSCASDGPCPSPSNGSASLDQPDRATAERRDHARVRWLRLAPSIPEVVAAVIAIATPLVFGHTWVSADGDPARHIRVGDSILRSGLFYSDPFSFTKPGAHFVPYEWLSEVLFALANRLAGLPGVLVLTGAVLGVTYAIVARTLLRRGVGPILTGLTLLFALALGSMHWQARPHIFTLLGAAVLMELIDRAHNQVSSISRRAIWSNAWPVTALFAAWANLHGGFLFGLCMLAAVAVGDRVEMLATAGTDRDRWRDTLIRHATMLGAAVVAVLLTPSGYTLYSHTIGYLRDTYLVNNTQEYLSPDFHFLRLHLIAIVVVVAVLAAVPRRPRYPTIALISLTLAFALLAVRNLPLFGIVAFPLAAAAVAPALAVWAPLRMIRWERPVSRRWMRLTLPWPLVAVAGMAGVAGVSSRAATSRPDVTRHITPLPQTFNPSVFPVRAVRAARAAHLTGRIFAEFPWGGYLLFAWPEQRVFIDGQTDFYGDSIMREYVEIHQLNPGWRTKLAAWRIDLALLITESPLADALAHEPGWRILYCDSTAVLFTRGQARGATLDPMTLLTRDCLSPQGLPLSNLIRVGTPEPSSRPTASP